MNDIQNRRLHKLINDCEDAFRRIKRDADEDPDRVLHLANKGERDAIAAIRLLDQVAESRDA